MRKLKNIKKHQNNNNNNKKQKRKKKHETKKQKQKNKWGKSQFLWHNLNQFSHDRSVRRYHSFRYTTQKIKFSIKHFFSKYDQIRGKMLIWSHLLNKSLMENFYFLCSDSHIKALMNCFENLKHEV